MVRPEHYLRPEVARTVRRLDLRARFIVHGLWAGLHRSPRRGASLEFSEHRKYALGDDPRRLDWTAWAKTDRLYVRTYQAESNLAAYLVLDTSRSMAYGSAATSCTGDGTRTRGRRAEAPRPAAMTKLEYAVALGAALAYLLVHQHDAVGLALAGSDLERRLRPRTGRRHLIRLLAELDRLRGEGPTALGAALGTLARRLRRRHLVLVLSDLVDDPDAVAEGLRRLAHRGHDLVVFQVLDEAERCLAGLEGPVVLEDPETGLAVATDADHIRAAYTERVASLVRHYARTVRGLGGDFAALTTRTPFDRALVRLLTERRRRSARSQALAGGRESG